MKSFRTDEREPTRWTAGNSTVAAERMAGVALRRAREATEPRHEEVSRLGARLLDLDARSSARPWHWRLALAALLLLAMGGAVGAAGALFRRLHPVPVAPAPRVARVATAGPGPTPRTRLRLVEALPGEVVVPTSPAADAPAAVLSRARPSAPPKTAPPPVARGRTTQGQPASSTEADLLARAFRSLRSDQDAAAALRALDGYDRAFPTGTLSDEARVARAEALLALDRRADALAVLATHAGDPYVPTRNVLVMRGELFAETGQCHQALPDFDRILGAGESGDAGARALFGRGICRLRTGDVVAGRGDLRRYLLLHPNGRLSAAAREALEPAP